MIQTDLILETDLSRRDARSLIFHLLYAAESFDYEEPVFRIIENFNEGFGLNVSTSGDIAQTVESIVSHRNDLDAIFVPLLENWRAERISTCSRLVIRYGVWELMYTKTPVHIVINEAIELAKSFAENDTYRFVNGILDRVSRQIHKPDQHPQKSDEHVDLLQ